MGALKGQRLIAIFLLGCVLLNDPLLRLFAGPAQLLGVPALYVYVFFVWALLIVLMALAVESRTKQ